MGYTGTPLYADSQGMGSRWKSYGSCAHRMRRFYYLDYIGSLHGSCKGPICFALYNPFKPLYDFLLNCERVLSKAFDADNDTFTEHFTAPYADNNGCSGWASHDPCKVLDAAHLPAGYSRCSIHTFCMSVYKYIYIYMCVYVYVYLDTHALAHNLSFCS